ncbi:anti-sigma factor [Demequina lignilytica]|uniref:Regulator of SigK n=1 Tax=Demequina lignilytica TaxID=3051663 RepID=A0AB35MJ21_9MICO|nr:anti-sigma factor [Demequina sp. SYSU T0a273]MDN4483789.1 anti-sigma factor [Demequina sp. SYSU T0a273]
MNDNVHGLLGAYAVDAVTDAERAAFDAHLPGCEDCAAELAGLRDVAAALADAEAFAPPAALRARVLEEVSRTAQLPPDDAEAAPADDLAAAREARHARSGHRWPRFVLAAASVAVLAGVGAFAGVVLTERNAELAMEQDVMMVASAPDAHSMDLDLGTSHLVVSDRMASVVAMGEDCPKPHDGMEYQLWVVMEDGSKHAGPTFMPESDGSFMTMLDDQSMDGVTGFVVTEEPMGGSDEPTGDMVAVVEL